MSTILNFPAQRTITELVLRAADAGEAGDYTLQWTEMIGRRWERHYRPLTKAQAKPLIHKGLHDQVLRDALYFHREGWSVVFQPTPSEMEIAYTHFHALAPDPV